MKDAFYFSHDSNAHDDPKCVMLIEQLGLEGYGIYWILIETLREQPDYKYPMILLGALARRYNTTLEKVKTVVLNYGLFIVDNDEVFLSESLCMRMLAADTKRKLLSEAGKRGNAERWGKREQLSLPELQIDVPLVVKEKEDKYPFEQAWTLYGRKGNKKTSQVRYNKLSDKIKSLIINHIPQYVKERPDKSYRKDFERYISNECWNDESCSNSVNTAVAKLEF